MKKLLAIGIIILLIETSIPSNANIIVDKSNSIQTAASSADGQDAYAFASSENYSGIFHFNLNDLKNLTFICSLPINLGSIVWISEEIMIFGDMNGNLYEMDIVTCDFQFLGNMGTGELYDLSYDSSTDTLYACTSYELYRIDMDDGHATLIGPFDQLGYYMVGIACSYYGKMYGVDLNYDQSRLYSIDTSTGHATPIGLIGGPSFMFGLRPLSYDKDNEVLYFCKPESINKIFKLYPIIGSGYNGTFQKNVSIYDLTIPFNKQNKPPEPPLIKGMKSGKVKTEYEYNFSLTDPDKDPIYLRVDWGTGTLTPWYGPFKSGSTIGLNHSWNKKGSYFIKAQAKDTNESESNWSLFEIIMPHSFNPLWWLNDILDRFPLLERLFKFYKVLCKRTK